jgi:hypothetical protein
MMRCHTRPCDRAHTALPVIEPFPVDVRWAQGTATPVPTMAQRVAGVVLMPVQVCVRVCVRDGTYMRVVSTRDLLTRADRADAAFDQARRAAATDSVVPRRQSGERGLQTC